MSLFGKLNDLWSQQPLGTTDQIAATDANTQAQQDAITQQKIADGTYSADQQALINADYANQDSNSVANQLGQQGVVLAGSLGDSLLHPIDTLTTGLTWEGQVAGNAVGSVTSAATGAAGNVLSKFLKAVPFWVWLAAAAGLFLWLGGGGFLGRKARGRLSR